MPVFQKKSPCFALLLFCFCFLFLHPAGAQPVQVSLTVTDESGLPTPVRVRLTDAMGKTAALPVQSVSVMYGRDDRAEGYGYQPDSSFYSDGRFSLELTPGVYHLSLSKGYEYLTQKHDISLRPGEDSSITFQLKRWIHMPARGWYSADDHIHIRRSPRENPLILQWIAAEDIHVGALLQMGDIWTTYFAQYAWGRDGLYSEGSRVLTPGQEDPRTHEVGHTLSLAARDFVRFREAYYLYDHVFDRVHELDGLTGYAHQGMSFNGYRGMTMDVLQEKVDFLELLQFCVEGGPLLTDHYYFFLDLGFELTATAGSDFPWCGKGPRFGVEGAKWNAQIGNARFYTYIAGDFSFDKWKENFRAGHTFVSSGPAIELRINGKLPGDHLRIAAGEKIEISAEAFGHAEQIPLENLEIIGHSRVLNRVTSTDPGQSAGQLTIKRNLSVDQGMWIAARCAAGPAQVAHTTPVYITIADGGFYNPETLAQNLDTCERYLQEIEEAIENPPDRMDHNLWRYKEKMASRLAGTRQIIAKIRTNAK